MPSDKKSSSSSSSSSSSDESEASPPAEALAQEPEPETVICDGDSSEHEEEREVEAKHRCWNLMWTFSTPRAYLADAELRKRRKEYIPDDFTRQEIADMFRDAVRRVGQQQNLREFIVVMEPHKKWKPDRSKPEMHFHIVFKMKANFAHLSIAKSLATVHGCKGHMSYPAKGWNAMVRYVLKDSGVKLGYQMDEHPLFWPNPDNTMTKEKMLQKVGASDPADASTKKEDWKEKGKRKRQLDFAQFTDWVVLNKITNEAEFWKLAGKEKEEHDNPSLWNYGGQICVAKMVVKAQKGHLAAIKPEIFQFASRSDSPFPLTDFIIPPAVAQWMANDTRTKSLIIQGTGGLGKTQLAKAILASLGKYFFVDSLDTIKHLFFVDGEALLCDDVTLSDYTIDQVKSLLDISCDRAIRCRHEDGMVPAGTIRIFLTNHQKLFFFPTGFQMSEHFNAIERRMTWVEVTTVLFRNAPIPVLDAVQSGDLPQSSGLQPESKAYTPLHPPAGAPLKSALSEIRTSATPKSHMEAYEAESMPGDSECERELQASLQRDEDEEAALLQDVYDEPIQKVTTKPRAGPEEKFANKTVDPFHLDLSHEKAAINNMNPFELDFCEATANMKKKSDAFQFDSCLNEALLIEAAERAEATASLARSSSECLKNINPFHLHLCHEKAKVEHMDPFELNSCLSEAVLVDAAERAEATASRARSSFEAALPIKSTSPDQSPRQPRLRHSNQAPPQSKQMLEVATHDVSADQPHAQKRHFEEEQASQPEPWTPEGSPPRSETDALHAGACPVHTIPEHSKADVASQPKPPPAAPAPHQSQRLSQQPMQSTRDSASKHTDKHCDNAPVPQATHDLHSAIPLAHRQAWLASPRCCTPTTDMLCIIADPLRRRSVALGSSHRSSQSPPWHRDRCRTRSPRWGSSHKVQRFGPVEK